MTWKHMSVAALVLAMLPALASADRGRYDRGDRYRDSYRHSRHGHDDSGKFSFSFGFGNHGYRDYSYFNLGYGRGYYPRYRHYSRPPVVYRDSYYYAPAPRVYVPPPRVYYYDSCGPSYYRDTRYYYGY